MAKKEYPKWVETADKKRVIVNSKEEEIKVTGKVEAKPEQKSKSKDWSN